MRYREVIVDGRVFLEIVDDSHELPQEPPRDQDRERDERDEDKGPWIGELVPYA